VSYTIIPTSVWAEEVHTTEEKELLIWRRLARFRKWWGRSWAGRRNHRAGRGSSVSPNRPNHQSVSQTTTRFRLGPFFFQGWPIHSIIVLWTFSGIISRCQQHCSDNANHRHLHYKQE
jgi:hypothetical protein